MGSVYVAAKDSEKSLSEEILEDVFLLENFSFPERISLVVDDVSKRVQDLIIGNQSIGEAILKLEDGSVIKIKNLSEKVKSQILKTLMDRLSHEQRGELAERLLQRHLDEDRELTPEQRHALNIGHELSLPQLLVNADFSEEEIDFLAENKLLERRKRIFNTRDGLTGFLGKGMISSTAGLEQINKRVPGPKLFVFLDFDNMGPPNDFGLGGRVDEFIKFFADLSREVFGSMKHEILRLGGDEFAMILPDTEEAIAKQKEFFEKLDEKRAEIFNAENLGEPFEQTMEKVRLRTGMRTVRKNFEEQCEMQNETFTNENFVQYLLNNGATLPEGAEGFSVERQVGILEESWVLNNKDKLKDPKIMSVSHGMVRMPKKILEPWMITQGIRDVETLMHKYKPKGEPMPEEILDLGTPPAEPQDGDYQQQLYEARVQYEKELRQRCLEDPESREYIQDELKRIRFEDVAVRGLLRLDQVKNERMGDFLAFRKYGENRFHDIKVDVPHFGAINNNEGYARGDATIDQLFKIIQKYFPSEHVFRLGGGEMRLMVHDRDMDKSKIMLLQQEVQQFWQAQKFTPQTVAEASEKQVLEEREDGNNKKLTRDLSFDSVTVQIKKKARVLNPDESLFKAF